MIVDFRRQQEGRHLPITIGNDEVEKTGGGGRLVWWLAPSQTSPGAPLRACWWAAPQCGMGTAPVTAVKHHRQWWRFHKTSMEAISHPFKTSTTNGACRRHAASSRITAAWHTLVDCRHLWFCFSFFPAVSSTAGHQLKKVLKLNHEVLWVCEAGGPVEATDRYLVPWRAELDGKTAHLNCRMVRQWKEPY